MSLLKILRESYPDLSGDYISKCGQHLMIIRRINYDEYELTVKGKTFTHQSHSVVSMFIDLF